MGARSAGLVVYRRDDDGVRVLLAHMGGPFWARRERAWSIPKGVIEPGEEPHDAALREYAEELGFAPPEPLRADEPLGEVRQSGGKIVEAWAREGVVEVDALLGSDEAGGSTVTGATATIPWPPRSGRTLVVPEVDRVAWVGLDDARRLVVAAQEAFLDRLVDLLATRAADDGRAAEQPDELLVAQPDEPVDAPG